MKLYHHLLAKNCLSPSDPTCEFNTTRSSCSRLPLCVGFVTLQSFQLFLASIFSRVDSSWSCRADCLKQEFTLFSSNGRTMNTKTWGWIFKCFIYKLSTAFLMSFTLVSVSISNRCSFIFTKARLLHWTIFCGPSEADEQFYTRTTLCPRHAETSWAHSWCIVCLFGVYVVHLTEQTHRATETSGAASHDRGTSITEAQKQSHLTCRWAEDWAQI